MEFLADIGFLFKDRYTQARTGQCRRASKARETRAGDDTIHGGVHCRVHAWVRRISLPEGP